MAPSAIDAGTTPSGSTARLLAANSVWQMASFAARAVSGLGAVVILARSDGPETLGAFQFALVLTALLPYYLGLPSLLAREVARKPEDARRWIEAGILIAVVAGAGFSLLLAVGARAVGASEETALAISLASIGMAFDGVARVEFAAFWAWERMGLEATVTALQEAAFLVGVLVVVGSGGGVAGALVAFSASRALGAVVGWGLVAHRLRAWPVPRGTAQFLRSTVIRSTPFAVNDTLTLTYMRADAVLLGILKGPTAVGLYQAGTNLVLNLNVVARSINRSFYPRMSRAWPDQAQAFRRLRETSLRTIGLIAMPVTVGSFLLAPETFAFLYGPEFAPAVVTYQVLVLVIPVRMIGNTISLALVATDRQRARMVAVTGAAALNLVLNLCLIPRWSYLGAAVATVISEVSLLVVYGALLQQVAGPAHLLQALRVPTVATVPMGVAIIAMSGSGLLVSAGVGAVVYLAALAALAVGQASGVPGLRPRAAMVGLVRSTT